MEKPFIRKKTCSDTKFRFKHRRTICSILNGTRDSSEAMKQIFRDTSESSNQIYRDIGLTNGCGMGALATPACNLQLEL
jgi:hypothetical protein